MMTGSKEELLSLKEGSPSLPPQLAKNGFKYAVWPGPEGMSGCLYQIC